MMPTGWPWMRANPVTSVVAVLGLELVRTRRRRRAGRSPRARRRACARRPARRRRARPVGDRRSTVGAHVPRPGRARGRASRRCDGRSRSACSSSSARWSVTPEILRVQVPAAQLLGGDDLAGGGLHQRRAAEEDRALVAHDHGLVAHRRDVGAARGARAEHRGDLRDARWRSSSPGCRRCGRSARGRGTPRPASAGTRRRSRRGRRTAGGSAARSPARAGAS